MHKIRIIFASLYLMSLAPVLASDQDSLENRQHHVNAQYDEDEITSYDLIGSATIAMSNLMIENALAFGYRFCNDQFFRESVTCSLILGRLVIVWIIG